MSFNVNISDEYRVNTTGDSKGSQVKYYKDGFWYKEDCLGDEGEVEYLVSLVLKHSNLDNHEYVQYERGIINGKKGCRSKDFTCGGVYNFVTLQRLYDKFGDNLYNRVRNIDDIDTRVLFVLDFFNKYYNFDLLDYFSKVFSLDLITLNEDRHFNNLGVLIDEKGKLHNALIFDNGLGLLNGNYSINRHFSIADNVKRVTSKPFLGSPERQFGLFEQGFDIDYIGLFEELNNVGDSFYKEVLEYQLFKYKDIFFKRILKNLVYEGVVVGTRIFTKVDTYDVNIKLPFAKGSIPLHSKNGLLVSGKEDSSGVLIREVGEGLISKIFS